LWSMSAAAAMAAGALDGGNPLAGLILAVVFIPFVVIPLAALLLFHAWLERRADKRRRSQGLPPAAGGQASRRPVSAHPARRLPQIRPDPRHRAEAGPICRPCPPLSSWRPPHPWRRPLSRRYAIGYPGH
jgi:hypothetical protein